MRAKNEFAGSAEYSAIVTWVFLSNQRIRSSLGTYNDWLFNISNYVKLWIYPEKTDDIIIGLIA